MGRNDIFAIGPQGTVHLFGVKLVGFNAETVDKLVVTLVLLILMLGVSSILRRVAQWLYRGRVDRRTTFWIRQGISLTSLLVLAIGLASVWFDDPARLATAIGLVTAGLAFALQKVVTSFAGYFVILRGRTFNVGDRIVMGGVRGDVVALGFMQTTIMEMGQPPGVQSAEPAMWVKSRQYTGRLVTVPNSKIFDEPVYNYTRDFDFIWEEMAVPLSYTCDRRTAEDILLRAADRHRVCPQSLTAHETKILQDRYGVKAMDDVEPRVYYRLTDNWLELSVRFLTRAHGVRQVKDSMSREIIAAFEDNGLTIASATMEIVGVPPVRLQRGETTMRAPYGKNQEN